MVATSSNFGTNFNSTTCGDDYSFGMDFGSTDSTGIVVFRGKPVDIIWIDSYPNATPNASETRLTKYEDLNAKEHLNQLRREMSREAHHLMVRLCAPRTPKPPEPEITRRPFLRPRGRSVTFQCINFRRM